MSKVQAAGGWPQLTRRLALQAGVTVGMAGAGLVAGGAAQIRRSRPVAAAQSGMWRRQQLAYDFVGVNGVVFDRLGGVNPPNTPLEQGDHCNVAWRLYRVDQTDGPQVGEYHCFGPYTGSATEQGMPGMDCITVSRLRLSEGTIFGIVDCCPPRWEGAGAVHGGTDAFLGAFGTIRQGGVRMGVWRATIDLYLPNV